MQETPSTSSSTCCAIQNQSLTCRDVSCQDVQQVPACDPQAAMLSSTLTNMEVRSKYPMVYGQIGRNIGRPTDLGDSVSHARYMHDTDSCGQHGRRRYVHRS